MNLTCLLNGHDWGLPRRDAKTRSLYTPCDRCDRRSSGVSMARGPRVLWATADDRWKAVPARVLPWLRRRA